VATAKAKISQYEHVLVPDSPEHLHPVVEVVL